VSLAHIPPRGAGSSGTAPKRYPERSRPTLVLWGEADNALPVVVADLLSGALEVGRPPIRLAAGHYLQEDQGPRSAA
jgi:pimeloyl-ACP methyl ester carboxylesterase